MFSGMKSVFVFCCDKPTRFKVSQLACKPYSEPHNACMQMHDQDAYRNMCCPITQHPTAIAAAAGIPACLQEAWDDAKQLCNL